MAVAMGMQGPLPESGQVHVNVLPKIPIQAGAIDSILGLRALVAGTVFLIKGEAKTDRLSPKVPTSGYPSMGILA